MQDCVEAHVNGEPRYGLAVVAIGNAVQSPTAGPLSSAFPAIIGPKSTKTVRPGVNAAILRMFHCGNDKRAAERLFRGFTRNIRANGRV